MLENFPLITADNLCSLIRRSARAVLRYNDRKLVCIRTVSKAEYQHTRIKV